MKTHVSPNAASVHWTDLTFMSARMEPLTFPTTLCVPLNSARTISPWTLPDDVSNTLRSRGDKSIPPRLGEVSWPGGLLELILQASQEG